MKKILIGIFICLFLVAGVFAVQRATAPHTFKIYEVKDTTKNCVQICESKAQFCASQNVLVNNPIPNTNYVSKDWEIKDCTDSPTTMRTTRCSCFK